MNPNPSLKALRAFETVSRHLSVSLAADELCVSQPAVTQQIKSLERCLGLQLIYRSGQNIALTRSGVAYAERLQLAFAEINKATSDLLHQESAGGAVVVSILPTFAQRWLIPRLGSFQNLHPDIDIIFSATPRLVDLAREDVDVAIRFGDGQWRNSYSQFMMKNDMFPVLSPNLQQNNPIHKVEDLANHTWLWIEAEPRSTDWNKWLKAAKCEAIKPKNKIIFETSSQALAAATAGLGVAMGHRPFVSDDLRGAKLVSPLDISLPSPQDYYLVTLKEAMPKRVKYFCDWLLLEAKINLEQP